MWLEVYNYCEYRVLVRLPVSEPVTKCRVQIFGGKIFELSRMRTVLHPASAANKTTGARVEHGSCTDMWACMGEVKLSVQWHHAWLSSALKERRG